jgi:hypothetical protein
VIRSLPALAMTVVVMAVAAGCLSVKSYVDPQLPRIGYGDLLFPTVLDTPGDDVDRLEVMLDNVADLGGAAGKGALTGLTFGAAGSMVTDGYVFTATFRPVGRPAVTKVYRHAIHSTIGSADGPPNLAAEPSTQAAFDKVVEGLS